MSGSDTFSPRVLAAASRCQLLTGSYEDNPRACPCESPGDCFFSEEQREQLAKLDYVQQAAARNREEFGLIDEESDERPSEE